MELNAAPSSRKVILNPVLKVPSQWGDFKTTTLSPPTDLTGLRQRRARRGRPRRQTHVLKRMTQREYLVEVLQARFPTVSKCLAAAALRLCRWDIEEATYLAHVFVANESGVDLVRVYAQLEQFYAIKRAYAPGNGADLRAAPKRGNVEDSGEESATNSSFRGSDSSSKLGVVIRKTEDGYESSLL